MHILMKIKVLFYLFYYRLARWRTHEVFLSKDPHGHLYIGARKHGQSPKNRFHLNLKSFGRVAE